MRIGPGRAPATIIVTLSISSVALGCHLTLNSFEYDELDAGTGLPDSGELDGGEDAGRPDGGTPGTDAGPGECEPGDTRPCPGGSSVGDCEPGTETCGSDGAWGDCEGAVGPQAEMCDNSDNDCDGVEDGLNASLACGSNAVCEDGSCRVSMCPTGMGDCDADISNGCEVDLGVDIDHCGLCGRSCAWTCGSGSCDDPVSMSAGRSACVLRQSGRVSCWGRNERGQLGNSSMLDSDDPVEVVGIAGVGLLENVTQVAAGLYSACARRSDSTVVCWGQTWAPEPVVVETSPGVPLGSIEQVWVGEDVACGLRADSTLRCWGRRRGWTSAAVDQTSPPSVVLDGTSSFSNVAELAIGSAHMCARRSDGSVVCWGGNQFGQRGRGEPLSGLLDYSRTAIEDLSGVTDIAAGQEHTCAVLDTGEVRCWGNNRNGQLGNGTMVDASSPVPVVGITTAEEIAAHGSSTCTRLTSGEIRCWGFLQGAAASTPAAVTGSLSPAISTGSLCAISNTSQLECWSNAGVRTLPAP